MGPMRLILGVNNPPETSPFHHQNQPIPGTKTSKRQKSHIPYPIKNTLQEINISHLGKRKIIFKMPFLGDMLIPWRVNTTGYVPPSFPGVPPELVPSAL